MAQGQLKNLRKKAAPSKAVSRRQNKTSSKKGKRTIAPKRNIAVQHEASVTTKAINRKNESTIAAKAIGVGTQFFLKDIAGKGKAELDKQLKQRDKKQKKTNQVARHVESLQKL